MTSRAAGRTISAARAERRYRWLSTGRWVATPIPGTPAAVAPANCCPIFARLGHAQNLEAIVSKVLASSPTVRVVLAVGETVFLLHPPLPLVVVSTWMERGCQ